LSPAEGGDVQEAVTGGTAPETGAGLGKLAGPDEGVAAADAPADARCEGDGWVATLLLPQAASITAATRTRAPRNGMSGAILTPAP